MRTHIHHGILRMLGAVAVGATVFLAGCDTLGDTETPEFDESVSFRFEFAADAGSVGEDLEVTTSQVVDLDDLLEDYGYTKGDVISVSVLAVELNLVQPALSDLSSFTQASLALAASGGAEQTVAQSSDLQGDSAGLSVTGSNVTGIATAPTFSAVLTVVPAVPEQFVVTAAVDLSIEVEGV